VHLLGHKIHESAQHKGNNETEACQVEVPLPDRPAILEVVQGERICGRQVRARARICQLNLLKVLVEARQRVDALYDRTY
jgi:hypothetical protein